MVNQYDVIKLDFNPVIGNEKGNYRPCLVISDSEFNVTRQKSTTSIGGR